MKLQRRVEPGDEPAEEAERVGPRQYRAAWSYRFMPPSGRESFFTFPGFIRTPLTHRVPRSIGFTGNSRLSCGRVRRGSSR